MSELTVNETASGGAGGTGQYRDAVVAGLGAGVVFGFLIQFVLGVMPAIGAMYTLGEPSLSVGWVAHLSHSAIFALLFVVVTWARPVSNYVRNPITAAAVGGAFGFALWLVNIGFLWPVWLGSVGVMDLPIPNFAPRPLVGHLVWGLLLGLFYSLLRR